MEGDVISESYGVSLQPRVPLEVVTQMSFSVGWTACAFPCVGAATATRTAWT